MRYTIKEPNNIPSGYYCWQLLPKPGSCDVTSDLCCDLRRSGDVTQGVTQGVTQDVTGVA